MNILNRDHNPYMRKDLNFLILRPHQVSPVSPSKHVLQWGGCGLHLPRLPLQVQKRHNPNQSPNPQPRITVYPPRNPSPAMSSPIKNCRPSCKRSRPILFQAVQNITESPKNLHLPVLPPATSLFPSNCFRKP